jgi:hypothetical protein
MIAVCAAIELVAGHQVRGDHPGGKPPAPAAREIRVGIADGEIRGTDHRALQEAVDRVAALGGGAVRIGPGRYVLRNALKWFFFYHGLFNYARMTVSRHETRDKAHGRQEKRSYVVCPVTKDLADRDRRPKLTAIGLAINETLRNGKVCGELRYYILSKQLWAKRFATAVRSHWSIENACIGHSM